MWIRRMKNNNKKIDFDIQISLNVKELQHVDHYKYLGVTLGRHLFETTHRRYPKVNTLRIDNGYFCLIGLRFVFKLISP